MNCPECSSPCQRDESIETPGGNYYLWSCSNCGWDEDQMFPMEEHDWEVWLSNDTTR